MREKADLQQFRGTNVVTRGLCVTTMPGDWLRHGSTMETHMDIAHDWLGEEWEAYCLLLLERKYGADNVQRVPARHDGDLGIEAFTHDGHALQCYAADSSYNTKDLYQAQRDKLTEDLGKLRKYQKDLLILLGPVSISKYLFMVPRHDSRYIVQHATTKAAEIRAQQLSHIAPDFRIVVLTDDSFADTREQVLKNPKRLIEIGNSSEEHISAWISSNSDLVDKVDTKLARVINGRLRHNYIEGLVSQYIDGNNALDMMRMKYPDQWEMAERYRNRKERMLVLEHTQPEPTAGVISSIAKEVEEGLKSEVPSLDTNLRKVLAWASVAEWLMRCPLDFYEEVDGN
ncbi:hypothetical protein [Actinomadura sp. NTSP31]|uniref:hypothetical protein n=1 Tax=Actinomadura sp. NTSP31 TaxID=1735447 RepID=UPI0035C043B9